MVVHGRGPTSLHPQRRRSEKSLLTPRPQTSILGGERFSGSPPATGGPDHIPSLRCPLEWTQRRRSLSTTQGGPRVLPLCPPVSRFQSARTRGHQLGQPPHPAAAQTGGAHSWHQHCFGEEGLRSPEQRRGAPPQKQSNSTPSLPSALILQQLYLFHLSNYHIIKCMNYKRAKALN